MVQYWHLEYGGEKQVSCNLDEKVVFLQQIALTNQQPDLTIWSDKMKHVIFMELTVPWENNTAEGSERKKNRYDELVMEV